jgi:alpha-1,2-mannosyltransferase
VTIVTAGPGTNGPSRFMRRINVWLRDFPLLTVRRAKFYSGVLLLAYLAAAAAQFAQSHHLIFNRGITVGGDFVNIYAASIAALKGQAASVYDIHRHYLRQMALMGHQDFGLLAFEYPPVYLLIVMPLSMLPYVLSWVVFETVTLAAYVIVLRQIARAPLGLWLAITFPAVIINVKCGQNGFLTTALLGGGLLLLDEWPLMAGFLFGLMVYKPQFAVLVPLALIIARRWRALAASAVSSTLFAAISFAVFGAPVWQAFFATMSYTQKTILERGAINFRTLQTAFGAIRMWGGSVDVAYLLQAVIAIYAAAAVVWIWRTRLPLAMKGATLAAGSLMVSPYVLQYDLVLLALPIAWLGMEAFEKGPLTYEVTILTVAWLVPWLSLPLSDSFKIPIAPIVIFVLMTAILRRASRRPSPSRKWAPAG